MSDAVASRRIEAIRTASRSLARVLADDPEALAGLAEAGPLPGPEGYRARLAAATEADGPGGLRTAKRRGLLEIAARDLAGEIELEETGRALADLADATIAAALEHLGATGLLAVIAMGKLGGRELNYSSDIDLMFVASPDALDDAMRAGTALIALLSEAGPQGQAYRVDMNLRPEGRNGPLVRSLDGYQQYYDRWADTWEFQALIKARACAGVAALGAEFVSAIEPRVYPAPIPAERVAEIRKMKERVEEHASRSARRARSSESEDVKLGPGGIRDVEFSVQLLQLVHGGSDPSVRGGNTLEALRALVDGGYVAEDDGAGLSVDLRWLRAVEHRIQLWQERQTHVLPGDPEARSALARAMGFRDSPEASAVDRFEAAHRRVLADVRGRFDKLFYRPMVEALADPQAHGLSPEALQERLAILGFRDVERAARTLDGLVAGTSRRARLFRVLTPAMLRFLASTPVPDEGLFSFLRLGEALAARTDLLGALRDNPPGLGFLAKVLGSGRLVGEMLLHVPEEVATIADPRGPEGPKGRERLLHEASASLGWRTPEQRWDGLRRFKRREMLRVALADLGGEIDPVAAGGWLADLADACVQGALGDESPGFAVIGMGKLGGRELNYSSDIDVLFVHEGEPAQGERIAEELLRAIGEVTPEGQTFRVDANLRPEGRSGPLARSIESYLGYYERWGQHWEHMALIKARVCAGDAELGERFLDATRRFAYPEHPAEQAVAQIRHLKARMERERIPRGVEPRRHLKLGPGGMSDIEFAVQLLQLRHGHTVPRLRVPGTAPALESARDEGLVGEEDALRLLDAYAFLMRLRNRIYFLTGRPHDALTTKPEDLEAIGIAMGFEHQPRQELEEAYLRMTRRVRRIAEPLIYG